MSGNLKPAPFALTPGVVRGLVGDGPIGSGIVLVPIVEQLRLPMHPLAHSAGEPSSVDPTRPSTWALPSERANDNLGGGAMTAKPATSRLKLNPPLGRMPVLQFMSPSELEIDESYQRGITESSSQTLIARIAQHWNWDLCQPLVVSRRMVDGVEHLFVIDGQHRLEAAKRRGDLAQLPCVVLAYASAADEAASFVHLNQQRRPLSKLALFRAAVASEDPEACAIHAAIAAAGLSIAASTNLHTCRAGAVSNIGGIQRAWNREGRAATERALCALGKAFAGQVQQYAGMVFPGIVAVCRDETKDGSAFGDERFDLFCAMLAKRSQGQWVTAINRYFGENPEMFRSEATIALMRDDWRRAQGGSVTVQRPLDMRGGTPQIDPKGQGFGLGAGDFKGDAEWDWCDQCDQRRSRAQAAACASKFCTLRDLK